MDKKNIKIISYLRRNARISLTELSKQAKIPVSTLHDRIKLLTEKQQFTTIMRFSELGFFAWAYILIKVGKNKKAEVQNFLMKNPSVNSLFKINNGYDFLMDVVCRDLKQMEEFLEGIENRFVIKTKEVHYIIEDLKRENFLAEPELDSAN